MLLNLLLSSQQPSNNQLGSQYVMHGRGGTCSLRGDQQEWWLMGKNRNPVGTSRWKMHTHHAMSCFHLPSLRRLRWREWGSGERALEKRLWAGAPSPLPRAAPEAGDPCCSSLLNCGAMPVWRGPAPTSRSRNGSWIAAREPQVWTPEVIDPWCREVSFYWIVSRSNWCQCCREVHQFWLWVYAESPSEKIKSFSSIHLYVFVSVFSHDKQTVKQRAPTTNCEMPFAN